MTNKPIKPESLLLRVHDLPVIPTAVAEILRVVNDSGASSVDVEWAVGRDQSVAAKVLKVVNSAAYGFSRRVETIREAVVMLGLRKMRDIAASMAASELFVTKSNGMVDGGQLWCHSLATSIWARQIITLKRLSDVDVAVTASLLHDIGILILDQYCNEIYADVLGAAKEKGRHHNSMERRILKTTHGRVAAQLCAKWQLPISLTQLISHHHDPFGPSEPALGVLMLADHLAHEYGHGAFSWGAPPPLPEEVLELLEINEDGLEMLVGTHDVVQEQVADFSGIVIGEE